MGKIALYEQEENTLAVYGEIESRLDRASNDFERLSVRDDAQKAKTIALIYNRKDLAIKFSNLMMDAEREIAKDNPPAPGKRTDLEPVKPGFTGLNKMTLSHIRKAHSIPDDVYTQQKQAAIEEGEPLTRAKLIDAKKKVKRAEKQKAREKLAATLTQQNKALPIGERKYSIIYADPPWKYQFEHQDTFVGNHYPTMSLDELKALDVPALSCDAAVIFMWTTTTKIDWAVHLLEHWGFVLKSSMIWIKENMGNIGYWSYGKHELLLVATRGGFSPPDTRKGHEKIPSVYSSPRPGGHSVKPTHFAEWIEKTWPNDPKIELFSRAPRSGWDAWGNEAGDRNE